MAVLLWSPAAQAQTAPPEPVYVPVNEALATIDESQAQRTVTEITRRRGFEGVAVFARELEAFSRPSWVQTVAFEPGRIVISHEKGVTELRLDAAFKSQVVTDSVMGLQQYGVPVGPDEVLWVIDGGFNSESRKTKASRLADALHVLHRAVMQSVESDAKLAEVAASYRAMAVKPPLPEEARRAKVQAEFAIGLKRYADAAAYFAEGLKHAPWWADGRFNRALLLAESGRYRDAVQEMRRYLFLAPDGPDARVAQDRIYQWEAAGQLAPAPPAK
ncbi:MAG: hypothetical protein EXR31_02775 [Betaproteobacteria bacterium]|nr:hypothetical protein [Betaproteobacteria bacterium]